MQYNIQLKLQFKRAGCYILLNKRSEYVYESYNLAANRTPCARYTWNTYSYRGEGISAELPRYHLPKGEGWSNLLEMLHRLTVFIGIAYMLQVTMNTQTHFLNT